MSPDLVLGNRFSSLGPGHKDPPLHIGTLNVKTLEPLSKVNFQNDLPPRPKYFYENLKEGGGVGVKTI